MGNRTKITNITMDEARNAGSYVYDDEKYSDLVNRYCVSCPLNKL